MPITARRGHADRTLVDGRFDTRYPADLEVWVTDMQHEGHSACGVVRDISESGVCVSIPLQFSPGDVVRLDVTDTVLFGFVTYSRLDDKATPLPKPWRTGIEVQRVLMGESDLSALLRQVLQEEMPQVLAGVRP